MVEKDFARFKSKYTVNENGCWLWTAFKTPKGYGKLSMGRGKSPARAHRLSYEHFVGLIPDGLLVLHSCDNPSCVNPDHLSVGTAKNNSQQMAERGRSTLGSTNPSAKLDEGKVLEMRQLIANGVQQNDVAQQYGVSKAAVTKIHFRRTWSHI